MHTALKAIKLSGFKSFVDPTSLHFKRSKTGVVGPNGCGKSNIVDAIRWVVGESSAKQLRGQAMSDVIFNGTANRQPVGQASVELVFDNEHGRINQGQYGQYQELSLKRVLGRDQQSSYFINGVRCRRRDVIDLLRGTGLGPRNYAIIEQGTISRVIEAKPDELRVYIEEVAGTAMYKDRRRETENRIRATRENLERMLDIQQELDKQLRHLKRQASAAERYKEIKGSLRSLKAEREVLAWRQFSADHDVLKSELVAQETALAQVQADLADTERHEAQLHQDKQAASDDLQAHQKSFYGLGAQLAQLEEKHKSLTMQKQSVQNQLDDLQLQHTQHDDLLDEHRDQQAEIESNLSGLEGQLNDAQRALEQSSEALSQQEQALSSWQQSWVDFTETSSGAQQTIVAKNAQLKDIAQQQTQLSQQLSQAQQALQLCDTSELDKQLSDLTDQGQALEASLSALGDALASDQQRVSNFKEKKHTQQQAITALQEQRANQSAELASLEALQQAAKCQDDDGSEAWLSQQGWQNKQRVMDALEVEPGWEKAVETVLGVHLRAICVDHAVGDILLRIGSQQVQNLVVHGVSDPTLHAAVAGTLQSKVKAASWASHLIASVYIAESYEEASKKLEHLKAHESVVTADGIWLGPGWLNVHAGERSHHGVLERKRAIEHLQQAVTESTKLFEQMSCEQTQLSSEIASLEEKITQAVASQHSMQTNLGELRSKYAGLAAQREQKKADHERLSGQMVTAESRLTDLAARQTDCQLARDQAEQAQASYAENKQRLVSKQQTIQSELQQARHRHQQSRAAMDELKVREQSLLSEQGYLRKRIEQDEQTFTQVSHKLEHLVDQLGQADEPIEAIQTNIQSVSERHAQQEQQMGHLQAKAGECEHKLDACTQKKRALDQRIEVARVACEKHRLGMQTSLVHIQTHHKNIQESGFVLDDLNKILAEDAQLEAWDENISTHEKRLDRLGPINLAAIEEFSQVSERKTYLDQQQQDLESALGILEAAIAKIDQETKSMFKATYDKVNAHFQEIFPKIFSGGRARLEMTENNLLEAGIVVKAQPPGKRNNSVHLLSGGEKALTAIALVFSLFEANPAPFCVLDEVDAPLDEVNVGRFCNIVNEMSKTVQFVVITHNKATMQHMDQLNGVTMHEAGVTRMVSVDIAAAVELVE